MKRRGFFMQAVGAVAALLGISSAADCAIQEASDIRIPESARLFRPHEFFMWSMDHSEDHSNDGPVDIVEFIRWKSQHPGERYVSPRLKAYRAAESQGS